MLECNLIYEKSVGMQFRKKLVCFVKEVVHVYLELSLFQNHLGKELNSVLSHTYMSPINVLTEWKICCPFMLDHLRSTLEPN